MPNLEGGPSVENVPERLINAIRESMGNDLKNMPPVDQNIIIKLAAQDLFSQLPNALQRAKEKRESVKGPAGLTVKLDQEGRVLGDKEDSI